MSVPVRVPSVLLDDPDGGAVIEDMLREWQAKGELGTQVSAAHILWETRSNPTLAEKERTLFLVDKHTTLESYPKDLAPRTDNDRKYPAWFKSMNDRYGPWFFWFWRVRQLMPMHPKAKWFRVIRAWGNYRPAKGEVLLVRRARRESYYVDLRCGVEGCACTGPLLMLVPGDAE